MQETYSKVTKENSQDNDLVDKLRNRDEKVISEIVREHHVALSRAALGRGLSYEMAEEVVAEVWSTFFANTDKYEGRSSIKTYLFGILFNKIRETRRANLKYSDGDLASELLDSNFNADGMWAYRPSDADEFASALEVNGFLEDCMQDLNETQNMILRLKDIDGLSLAEICNVAKIKMSNVKVSLHRIRNQVRRCVEGKIA